MRRAAVLLVALSLSFAAPARATTTATTSNPFARRVGFTQGSPLLWEPPAQQATDLDGMVRAGAHWVEADIDWPSTEPQRGTFNWSAPDRLIAAARARGLQVMGAIVYTPVWARPTNTTDKTPPTNAADYGAFAHAVAARYAPLGVHDWQVWNEPNVQMFWAPGPQPARFVELLRAAHTAIHAVDRQAVVIAGGLAPAADVGHASESPLRFLADLYHFGAHGQFDALALHPYSFPYAPTTAAAWNPFFLLPWFHLVMAVHGDGAKAIWGTEVGFGTGHDGQSVSEAVQAQRVVQVVVAWQHWSFTGPLFFYDYRDLDATNPQTFDHMGLVRSDGTPKPAYRVLQFLLHAH
jgi:hypothetical protein